MMTFNYEGGTIRVLSHSYGRPAKLFGDDLHPEEPRSIEWEWANEEEAVNEMYRMTYEPDYPDIEAYLFEQIEDLVEGLREDHEIHKHEDYMEGFWDDSHGC